MGRLTVVLAHALSSLAAAALFFLFVLPRWWELAGSVVPTWGTVLRILTGLVVALAAVPVLLSLLRARRPEFGTPQLALTLRSVSIGGHVLAAVVIIGTAVSEIWLSLDDAGQWLFGLYGAAAAIAVLGIAAFYLSLLAERPAPPPKPIKPKAPRQWRRRRAVAGAAQAETTEEAAGPHENTEPATTELDATAEADAAAPDADTVVAEIDTATDTDTEATSETETETDTATESTEAAPTGGLRNRRPTGKGARQRRRTRGGHAGAD
ncbi:hypothetical protein [Mycolicibacillus trivialis]|uniref:Transmembrane protein n=1 Tax=Mycolicibacillus trivialis TaxID=1798 RepID=A0A1X2EMX6_9MYCO|nr:hypothetical protein [Mycolicibacillus trivialis]ORX06794.1 hypothetical protein AWC30_05845 [Mycolicibacillus trivialis]